MQLEFTGDQEELRAAVRELLDRECPTSVVRDRVEKGTPATALWARMVELGWPALTVPEDAGGLGLGPVEMAVVAEELGRRAAPVPWLSTATQYAALLRELGATALLAEVASGDVTGTLAVAEDAVHPRPEGFAARAERRDGGWVVSGEKRYVWDASGADRIAVVAGTADGAVGAFVVDRGQVDVRPVRTTDASREWATVRLDRVEVAGERSFADCGPAVDRALDEATVAAALELVGTCSTLLDLTVDYAKTRHQFGVPIGSFQAVKHKLADCYVAVERARASAYFAAATLAEDDPRRATAVPMAKVAAGDCQRRMVQDALQTFGGIGYTWEHDLHLFLKRAMADEMAFGTSRTQRERLADELGLRR